MTHLRTLLDEFAISTGLKFNFRKPNLYPTNVAENRLHELTDTLHCQLGSFPFTYLGLPLGINKPEMEHMMPLVTAIFLRINW
jgi:hypothetical protein